MNELTRVQSSPEIKKTYIQGNNQEIEVKKEREIQHPAGFKPKAS